MVEQVGQPREHLPLPAPAGAVGLATACCAGWAAATHAREYLELVAPAPRGARPTRALDRHHRRLSRARPTTTSRRRSTCVREVRFAALFAFKYSPRPARRRRASAATVDRRASPPSGCSGSSRSRTRSSASSTESWWGGARGAGHRLGQAAGHAQPGRTACHRIVHFHGRRRAGARSARSIRVRHQSALSPHSLLGRARSCRLDARR